jgi:predicted dithiol-disulfide oxidoreductase (DUF899 family)
MSSTATVSHKVVSKNEWLRACADFLAKEKELSRLSDEVARLRRQLPWTRVEKNYVFDGPQGPVSLVDLFGEHSQLAVYHFMLGPDSVEGCKGCSYVTDHLDGTLEHLAARDVSLVLVSRASLPKIEAFKKRMGWRLPWVSSAGNDFNHDFAVSFTKDEVASQTKNYNFGTRAAYGEENPGMSFLYKDAEGAIFHTYATFARGLDALLGTYVILDRAPKGRDEEREKPMDWVRRHDEYQPTTVQLGASCCKN